MTDNGGVFGIPEVWIERAIVIVVVIVVAVVGRWLLLRSVDAITKRTLDRAERRRQGTTPADRLLAAATGANTERFEQRARTVGSLLRSIVSISIMVIAALTILATLQVPLAPLLASAGVGGIALAFGAQSVVKDVLSGLFMIMEDQYGVGDLIDTGEVTGTVEEVGLRITRLRDPGGQIWYVRNGEVLRVGNQTQGWSTAVADIPIGNDEPTADALEILAAVAGEVGDDPEFADVLLDKPNLVGVESVSAAGTILRIVAKTAPNQHWGVKRVLLQRGIKALGEAGYHGPISAPIAGSPPAS